jgi:hypothetical protein
MACLHLGYPEDVTLEWDDKTKSFYLSIKERCIYDFELTDKNLEFSFSIPFPDGEGIERNGWIFINEVSNNIIMLCRLSGENKFIGVTKENVLKVFGLIGCTIVNSVPHS